MFRFWTFNDRASRSPTKSAPYCTRLFITKNLKVIVCWIWKTSGLLINSPDSDLSLVEEPSTCRVHASGYMSFSSPASTIIGLDRGSGKENSTTKSARTWALIAVRSMKESWNWLNSTTQLIIRKHLFYELFFSKVDQLWLWFLVLRSNSLTSWRSLLR